MASVPPRAKLNKQPGRGVPGQSLPTNEDTPRPSPSSSAMKPVILSSQRELVLSTTSCAMGLRNSLRPMDFGLQLGG